MGEQQFHRSIYWKQIKPGCSIRWIREDTASDKIDLIFFLLPSNMLNQKAMKHNLLQLRSLRRRLRKLLFDRFCSPWNYSKCRVTQKTQLKCWLCAAVGWKLPPLKAALPHGKAKRCCVSSSFPKRFQKSVFLLTASSGCCPLFHSKNCSWASTLQTLDMTVCLNC